MKSCFTFQDASVLDAEYQAFKQKLALLQQCYGTLSVPNGDISDALNCIFEHPACGIILLGDRGAGRSTFCNSLLGARFSPDGASVSTLDLVHFGFTQDHPRYEILVTGSSLSLSSAEIVSVELPSDVSAAANVVRELLANAPATPGFSRIIRVFHRFPLLQVPFAL